MPEITLDTVLEAMHWIGITIAVLVGAWGFWTAFESIYMSMKCLNPALYRKEEKRIELEKWDMMEKTLEAQLEAVRRVKKERVA